MNSQDSNLSKSVVPQEALPSAQDIDNQNSETQDELVSSFKAVKIYDYHQNTLNLDMADKPGDGEESPKQHIKKSHSESPEFGIKTEEAEANRRFSVPSAIPVKDPKTRGHSRATRACERCKIKKTRVSQSNSLVIYQKLIYFTSVQWS